MTKYAPLRTYLQSRRTDRVPMTFSEIEAILGFKLPRSQAYPAWWSNNPTNNVMTNEWLAAGYKTEQVDIEGRKLVFRRTGQPDRPSEARQSALAKPGPKEPRRHRLFGWMKGTITILPGTDLTDPADPEWGDIAWGMEGADKDKSDKAGET